MGRISAHTPPPRTDEPSAETLLAVYERNAKMNETFFDWRHKLLTFFATGTGLAAASAEYLYSHGRAGLTWIPGAGVAIWSLALLVMDTRNANILQAAHDVGKQLEDDLHVKGFYSEMPKRTPLSSYTNAIRFLAIAIGGSSLGLSIYASLR